MWSKSFYPSLSMMISGEPSWSCRRLYFTRPVSGASSSTFASISTVLPEYSVVERNPRTPVPTQGREGQADPGGCDCRLGSGATHASNATPFPAQENVVNPPRFADALNTDTRTLADPPELLYSFPIKSGNTWATLKLHTRDGVPGKAKPSRYRPKLPRIWSCDPLKGVIQLDLDRPKRIQQIYIVLKGEIATLAMGGQSLQFLEHTFKVWDKSWGNPNADDRSPGFKEKFSGNLVGKYSFPFLFPLPTHVNPLTKFAVVPTVGSTTQFEQPDYSEAATSRPPNPNMPSPVDRKKQRFAWLPHFGSPYSRTARSMLVSLPQEEGTVASPLPQSFMERGEYVTVSYELSVLFVHGKLRPDTKIKTGIIYSPALHPLPASLKRRRAYEEAALIPNPFNDPEGWFSLAEVPIVGILHSQEGAGKKRRTTINCKLYVAEPLSYTRGASIPCFLSLSSGDSDALQRVASSGVPVVRLMRHVHHVVPRGLDPYEGQQLHIGSYWQPGIVAPCAQDIGENFELKVVSHEAARAVWWLPPKDVSQETFIRHLEGEIHLSPHLQPSCACSIFRVQYVVEMLSLQCEYFEPEPNVAPGSGLGGQAIVRRSGVASVPVEIMTLYRQDEPLPTPRSEPSSN